MAVYGYKGVSSAGRNVKGVRDAGSMKELKSVLKGDGVFVTDVWELGTEGADTGASSGTAISIDLSSRVTAPGRSRRRPPR